MKEAIITVHIKSQLKLANTLSLNDDLCSSGAQSQPENEVTGLLHTLTEIGPHCCVEPRGTNMRALMFVLDMPLCESACP